MREVKSLSSAVASVRPGRTGSQHCLERPRKTKGLWLGVWGRVGGWDAWVTPRASSGIYLCGFNFKREHCNGKKWEGKDLKGSYHAKCTFRCLLYINMCPRRDMRDV